MVPVKVTGYICMRVMYLYVCVCVCIEKERSECMFVDKVFKCNTCCCRFRDLDQGFPLCYHHDRDNPSICDTSVDFMQIFCYPIVAYVAWQLFYIIMVRKSTETS